MAKFTELEKERIREELLEVAYRFFLDKGFKSTSIEDITSSVGIFKEFFLYILRIKRNAIYGIVST
ncbi:MAG: hypothetical protein KBH87_05630 [Leptotrichiaceae bacterium]|jgi:hypothetical protein|nr:hypothetical protein [Fusobacteriaceae bacterium]MBP8637484.1 hypothetical protein [Leptotrichiaceae bacterium]